MVCLLMLASRNLYIQILYDIFCLLHSPLADYGDIYVGPSMLVPCNCLLLIAGVLVQLTLSSPDDCLLLRRRLALIVLILQCLLHLFTVNSQLTVLLCTDEASYSEGNDMKSQAHKCH